MSSDVYKALELSGILIAESTCLNTFKKKYKTCSQFKIYNTPSRLNPAEALFPVH